MGFHAVAFGLIISHGFKKKKFLSLVAKEHNIVDDIIQIKLRDDIICKYGKEFEIRIDVLMYVEFTYVNNPHIKIGLAHICAFGIYLGCVGDDLGGEDDPLIIEDQTLNDLLAWKQQLVQQERLSENVRLRLVGSCCS